MQLRARALEWVLIIAMAAAWSTAAPQQRLLATATANDAVDVDCHAPERGRAHPLADRAETLSLYEALTPRCLKTMFIACAHAANAQLLDLQSAAICSIGYEALLRRGFSGDFHALMAWWRIQRHDPLLVP